MPRYVVLHHRPGSAGNRPPHWDFMLESGDLLHTWALASQPQPDHPIEAERLPDHRLIYLDYEGPLTGQRGVVSRWDAGWYEVANRSDVELWIVLRGRKLNGPACLRASPPPPQRWTIRFSGNASER
jgi:hypothetical protein